MASRPLNYCRAPSLFIFCFLFLVAIQIAAVIDGFGRPAVQSRVFADDQALTVAILKQLLHAVHIGQITSEDPPLYDAMVETNGDVALG